MAPNLMLLTLTPEITGLTAPTEKLSLFARLTGFILRSQVRRGEQA